jgi:hypothetical protein
MDGGGAAPARGGVDAGSLAQGAPGAPVHKRDVVKSKTKGRTR